MLNAADRITDMTGGGGGGGNGGNLFFNPGGFNGSTGTVPGGNPTGVIASPIPQLPNGFGNNGMPIDINTFVPQPGAVDGTGTLPNRTPGTIPTGDGTTIPTNAPAPLPTTLPANGFQPGGDLINGGGTGLTGGLNPSQALGLVNSPQLSSELDQIYGPGMGAIYAQMLTSGGGYNQTAVNALINQMQPQVNRNWQNIATQLGNAGLSPSGSAYALASGDYFSQVTGNENALLAGEYDNSVNRVYNALGQGLGAAELYQANKSSIFDKLSQALGLGSSAASLLNSLKGLTKGGSSSSSSSSSGGSGFPGQTVPGKTGSTPEKPTGAPGQVGGIPIRSGGVTIRNGNVYERDPNTGLMVQISGNAPIEDVPIDTGMITDDGSGSDGLDIGDNFFDDPFGNFSDPLSGGFSDPSSWNDSQVSDFFGGGGFDGGDSGDYGVDFSSGGEFAP